MYDELKLAENDDISFTIDDDKLIKYVSHNQVLNCLLLLTKSNNLYIYDCNTRSYLTKVRWNALQQTVEDDNSEKLVTTTTPSTTQSTITSNTSVKIINIQDKCIVLGEKTLCSRTVYDGTLLLDSVFQLSTNSSLVNIENLKFEIELSLSDAYTLVNVLKLIEIEQIHGLDDIISQLTNEIQKNRSFKNDLVSASFSTDRLNLILKAYFKLSGIL